MVNPQLPQLNEPVTTEDRAVKIVQQHARYLPNLGPPNYVLRWPPTNNKALFANSPRELVVMLLSRDKGKT